MLINYCCKGHFCNHIFSEKVLNFGTGEDAGHCSVILYGFRMKKQIPRSAPGDALAHRYPTGQSRGSEGAGGDLPP
jgi:hypothetical protein